MNIAIVEDNENVREALRLYLELEGFRVQEYGTIREFERNRTAAPPDLLLLDIMLPDGDGFLPAKRLRSESNLPIIILTARTEESDRITGFEVGADDYIIKPFSPKEAVLRVKAVLRRSDISTGDAVSSYQIGDAVLSVSEDQHLLELNGRKVTLTMAEWKILLHLIDHAPQVFNRMQILSTSLDYIAEGSERTVDTHIKNIRRKLGDNDWIETVRGFGYRFGGKPV